MEQDFNLEIISPEKILLKDKVKSVTIPSFEGEMTILPDHIPLITFLRPGLIEIDNKNKIFIEDGTVEFYKNNLLVLSTSATNLESLDKNEIKEKIEDAQKQLSKNELTDKQRYMLNHKLDTLNFLN